MNLRKKITTLTRLLLTGDRVQFANRARYNLLVFRTWLGRGEPFVFRKAGVRYVCYPGSSESMVVSALAPTDPVELVVLRRWLRKGDVFLDGGANLGIYAAAAAQFVGRRGRVVAIDAGERIIKLLADTAVRLDYPQLHCIHAAIGNRDGTVSFYEALHEGSSHGQSLRLEETQKTEFVERPVSMLMLRSLGPHHLPSTPAAIKLDLEGAEGDALAGAPPSWFGPDGPLWFIEINAPALALFETTSAQIVCRFEPTNFERWLVPKKLNTNGGNGPIRRLTEAETWLDSAYYNLVAVPRGATAAARRAAVAALFPGGIEAARTS